ncbi:hypothetical protein Dimus_022336 [Dionaea muscipula]
MSGRISEAGLTAHPSHIKTPYGEPPFPESPLKKVLKKALSEVENSLIRDLDRRLEEGRVWVVNMKPSLSSLQSAGIISGSLDPCCPELELSSSYFLSVGGGGSARSHGPGDDDVEFYVGSRRPSSGLLPPGSYLDPILDETGMTKGLRLQLPPEPLLMGAEEGEELEEGVVLIPPISMRVSTHDLDDRGPEEFSRCRGPPSQASFYRVDEGKRGG